MKRKILTRIIAILLIIITLAICTYVNAADYALASAQENPVRESTSIPEPETSAEAIVEAPKYIPNPADVTMLAKLTYGEARGVKSITEQTAVMWCALNRVDSSGYGMGRSVKYVVTFPDQFAGYNKGHPTVDDYGRDLEELAKDVLVRWMMEHDGYTDVGRVLPKEFKWFDGDGIHNHFRDAYKRSEANYYGWTLTSPYES